MDQKATEPEKLKLYGTDEALFGEFLKLNKNIETDIQEMVFKLDKDVTESVAALNSMIADLDQKESAKEQIIEENEDDEVDLKQSIQFIDKLDTDVQTRVAAIGSQIAGINSENENENNNRKKNLKNLRKDTKIVLLFMFLYIIQGVPYGLSSSMPLILSSKKASWIDQGIFSFRTWSGALRFLWSPLIDSLFIKKLGRRKSWLFPTQLTYGILMIALADYVNDFVENANSTASIYSITAIFMIYTIFNSIFDNILDGWLLTLLSKENLAWQSVCNSTGASVGVFLGNPIFLTFNSPEFSNYLRSLFNMPKQSYGLVNIKNYYHVLGTIYIAISLLILFFKSEFRINKNVRGFKLFELKVDEKVIEPQDKYKKLTVLGTYKLMLKIFKVKYIPVLIVFLVTLRLGFSAEEAIRLKIVEEGVPRERISIMGLLLSPFLIFIPILLIRFTNRTKPLTLFLNVYCFKLAMVLILTIFVYYTPSFRTGTNQFPLYYYIIYFVLNLINASFGFTGFFCVGSFFAQISDKAIGSTYMTFLSTIMILSVNLTRTFVFFLIDITSKKVCYYDFRKDFSNQTLTSNYTMNSTLLKTISSNKCSSKQLTKDCRMLGGTCFAIFDSFYLISLICVFFGIIWFIFSRKVAKTLQSLDKSVWLVVKRTNNADEIVQN